MRDETAVTKGETLVRDGGCLDTAGIGANETVLVARDLLTAGTTEGVVWSEADVTIRATDAVGVIETTPTPMETGLPFMLPSVSSAASSSASKKALSRATVACLSLFRSS